MKKLKIGIAQMWIDGGNPDANLAHAVEHIEQAAERKCDLVVLPECIDFGWTHSLAVNGAVPIPGIYTSILQEAAKQGVIHVVAGLTERFQGKIYNTAIVISSKGTILGKHRKINILDIAKGLYTPGQACEVISTSLGILGVNVCADNLPETNSLGHALGILGAQIIVSPCSWAVPPDFDNRTTPYGAIWKQSYGEIASKHGIPIVAVSNTGLVKDGAWQGWNCIGSSLVIAKDGSVQKQFDYTKRGSNFYSIEVDIK